MAPKTLFQFKTVGKYGTTEYFFKLFIYSVTKHWERLILRH